MEIAFSDETEQLIQELMKKLGLSTPEEVVRFALERWDPKRHSGSGGRGTGVAPGGIEETDAK